MHVKFCDQIVAMIKYTHKSEPVKVGEEFLGGDELRELNDAFPRILPLLLKVVGTSER